MIPGKSDIPFTPDAAFTLQTNSEKKELKSISITEVPSF